MSDWHAEVTYLGHREEKQTANTLLWWPALFLNGPFHEEMLDKDYWTLQTNCSRLVIILFTDHFAEP